MILCQCAHCGKWIDTRVDFTGIVFEGLNLHLACALSIILANSKLDS